MNNQDKQWKILELLKLTESLFIKKSIYNPRLNAELLLSKTLNIERINLYTEFDKPLNSEELSLFRDMVKRRLNYEPLQYIFNEANFYGRKFKVDPSVLIPRPETELLVEKTLDAINRNKIHNPRLLEIGTGSGCISISIAANIKCHIEAIDFDENAVAVAVSNASNYELIGTIHFTIFDFLRQNAQLGKYDVIISNPPYIPSNEFVNLPEEIRNYEPKLSLTDNGDGLTFYRKLLELYKLADRKPVILLEIGDNKKNSVENLIKEHKIMDYVFHKDLMNIDRVLEI